MSNRSRVDVQGALKRVDQAIHDHQEETELLQSAVEAAWHLGLWQRVAISQADPYSNTSAFIAEHGFGPTATFDLTDSLALWAIISGQPHQAADASRQRRSTMLANDARRAGYAGVLVVPLPTAPPELALWIVMDKAHRFSRTERFLAQEIATHIGMAVEQARFTRRAEGDRKWLTGALRGMFHAFASAVPDKRGDATALEAARRAGAAILLLDEPVAPRRCLVASPTSQQKPPLTLVDGIWRGGASAGRRALRLAADASYPIPLVVPAHWWIPETLGSIHLTRQAAGPERWLLALWWSTGAPSVHALRSVSALGSILHKVALPARGLRQVAGRRSGSAPGRS